MNKSEEELQKDLLIATIVLFIAVGISVLLSYDEYLKAQKEDGLFTDQTAYYLLLIDRIVFLSVFVYFLYVNYIEFQKKKQNPREYEAISTQLVAYCFNIIAGLISLYVVINFPKISETELEEPVF